MAVVVVGHGPSVEGKAWGPQIDAQECVVRMWNHEWQSADDYGRRYDHGLITLKGEVTREIRRPRVSWFFYNGADNCRPQFIDRKRVHNIKWEKWVYMARSMGAKSGTPRKALKLTRGFVAAAAALEILQPKRMILIGMDMIMAGKTVSPRYGPAGMEYNVTAWPGAAIELEPPGSRHEGPHDYAIENALIVELAEKAGTEISWGF